jgi:hypothetical protein
MIELVLRPLLGVVLLCCAFGASRQPGRTVSAVAFVCAAVAIGLWPPPILLVLDRSTGYPGFGYMLTRSLVDAGILLHVVDVMRATRYWDRACKVLLAVAIVALAGFIAAWLWTQGMGISAVRAEHLYYDSFPGRPNAMFALSIMVGVQSAASAVFAAYVVGRQTVVDRAAKRTRLVVFGIVMIFLWAYDVSWSFLGPIEGLIERYGQPVPFIVWYVRISILILSTAYTVLAAWFFIALPLLRLKHAIDGLPAMRAEVEARVYQVTEANMMMSDQMVLMRIYADANIVKSMMARCARDADLVAYHRTVAWEMTNLLTLNPDLIHQMYAPGEEQLNPGEIAVELAKYADFVDRELYLYADVGIAAGIVFRADERGVMIRGAQWWHRRIAQHFADVMVEYDQPIEKLAAYRRYRARHAALKDDISEALVSEFLGGLVSPT